MIVADRAMAADSLRMSPLSPPRRVEACSHSVLSLKTRVAGVTGAGQAPAVVLVADISMEVSE